VKTVAVLATYAESLSDYWASVYPSVPYGKAAFTKAVDASSYARFIAGFTICATTDYNEELVPLYVECAAQSTDQMGFAFSRSVGLPLMEDPSVSDILGTGRSTGFSMNYALMGLDYDLLGSIHSAHQKSIWAPATTFAPNLICPDTRPLNEIILACCEAFTTTAAATASMFVVMWSKFLRAACRSTCWPLVMNSTGEHKNIVPISGSFDEVLVPPAVTEWVSGFGPLINDGRVTWPVLVVDAGRITGYDWVSCLVNGFNFANKPPCQAWNPSFASPAGIVVGSVTFNSTNFPNTSIMPAVPDELADVLSAPITALAGYRNFVPCEATRFGLIDMHCLCVLQDLSTTPSSADFPGVAGFLIKKLSEVSFVLSPRVITGPDIYRIATHRYRSVNSAASAIAFMPFRSARLRIASPAYIAARFMSAGTGWTVLGEEFAQREAQDKSSFSIDGLTVAPVKTRGSELATVRSIAGDFFNEASSVLVGLSSRPIKDVALDAAKATSKLIVSEFLPFGGPILSAGIEYGVEKIRKLLSSSETADVKRKGHQEVVKI
jgi:hypothetical protein